MWEQEIQELSYGEGSLIILIIIFLIYLAIPYILLVLYYVNQLLVVWDEWTVYYTVPNLVAESILFVNILVSFVVLYSHVPTRHIHLVQPYFARL